MSVLSCFIAFYLGNDWLKKIRIWNYNFRCQWPLAYFMKLKFVLVRRFSSLWVCEVRVSNNALKLGLNFIELI